MATILFHTEENKNIERVWNPQNRASWSYLIKQNHYEELENILYDGVPGHRAHHSTFLYVSES